MSGSASQEAQLDRPATIRGEQMPLLVVRPAERRQVRQVVVAARPVVGCGRVVVDFQVVGGGADDAPLTVAAERGGACPLPVVLRMPRVGAGIGAPAPRSRSERAAA